MKISIAMATYNGADYIIEQLQSFSDQSRLPDEVIITDDCSSDKTVTLIENYAKTAPFDIKVYVNKENLRYAGNFNEALTRTTGDLVFLSDQDDVWSPKKIEHIEKLAEQHKKYFLYMNDALLTDGKLNSVNLTKYGQIKSAGLPDSSFLMGCCCAFRREFLDIVLPIPKGLKAHDNWLVEIADGMHAKLIDPVVLQYYRRHDNNESQTIANRLTKINRWSVIWQALKLALSQRDQDNFVNKLEQMQIFLKGLECTRRRVPPSMIIHFEKIIQDRRLKFKLAKARLEVRQSKFFHRIVKGLALYRNGYPKHKRFKNMIRDILG